MNELKLFTDGSVHAQSAIGYGAYLSLSEHRLPVESLTAHVQTKRFTHTSSTKLELQTLLWVLSETVLDWLLWKLCLNCSIQMFIMNYVRQLQVKLKLQRDG